MVMVRNNTCVSGEDREAERAQGLGTPSISWPSWWGAHSKAPGSRPRLAAPGVNWSVGTVCAVVFLELLSRQLTSNLGSLERPSPAASFKPDPAAVEETYKVRWCSEGCATSHFSRDGAR